MAGSVARRLRTHQDMRTWGFLLILAAGCGTDSLENTTYRRLIDPFESYDQCLAEGNFMSCYQTLTFCTDGRANANLETREEGPYQIRDTQAILKLPTVTVV